MVEDAKTVVSRFVELAWNQGRLEEASAFLDPGVVDHDALEFPGRDPGAAGLLQVVAMIRSGMPDLHRTVELQFAEGDLVVTRFVDEGTQTGALLGTPPTGRRIAVRGINIDRVADGRIIELWHVEDIAGLMAQLNAGAASVR
jgi:steroid delta-isomerase-like uncharacterized protein